MHAESLVLMDRMLTRRDSPTPLLVLDVGSYNVNGSYRDLVGRRGWSYIGLDVRPGPNVDVVSAEPYRFPCADGAFDVVICGNMIQNVESPWLLIPEMARVLKPGGLLAVVAPAELPGLHPYPKDFFRYRPDGLKVLFDAAHCLNDYQIIYENMARDVAMSALKTRSGGTA